MSKFSAQPKASSFLNLNQEKILHEWTEVLTEEKYFHADTDRVALLDSMPTFLQNITNWLKSGNVPHTQILAENISSTHGDQRAGIEEYSIGKILSEYYILKRIIFRMLKEQNLMNNETAAFFDMVFSVARREAATAFSGHRLEREKNLAYTDSIIDPKLLRRAESLSAFVSLFVAFAGICTLLEWVLNLQILFRNPAYDAVVAPSTAICFTLSGLALYFTYGHTMKSVFTKLSKALFGIVFLFSSVSLAYYTNQLSIYPDQMFNLPTPLMAMVTSVSFLLLSLIGLLMKFKFPGAVSCAQFLAGLLILIGYNYSFAYYLNKFQPEFELGTKMAFPTALGFLLLGISSFLSRASSAQSLLFVSPHGGGFIIRRITPLFFIVPFLFVAIYLFVIKIIKAEDTIAFLFVFTCFYFAFYIATWVLALKVDRSDLDRENTIRNLDEIYAEKIETQNEVEALTRESIDQDSHVSAISHDIRSPLSNCRLIAEMVLSHTTQDERTKKMLSRLIGNIDRTDSMITTLIGDRKKRNALQPDIRFNSINLSRLINTVVEENEFINRNQIETELDETIVAEIDEDSIRRVIENLCSNAIKYGDISKGLSIKLKQIEDSAMIEVHNWGNPISQVDQIHLFERFYRTDTARLGEQKGWGVGLSFVQHSASAHHGEVSVTSTPEHGTSFRVFLPLVQ